MVAATPSASQLRDSFRPGPLSLPQALTDALRLTPEQFEQLCQVNPEAVLELAADGHLIAMTPTGGDTGARNGELFFQIKAWARAREGWMAFDSSTGFRLPDDAVLSPDTSLVALDRWQTLTPEQRRRIPPLCPDLVVELAIPQWGQPQRRRPPRAHGPAPEDGRLPAQRRPPEGGGHGRRIEAATRLQGDPEFSGHHRLH